MPADNDWLYGLWRSGYKVIGLLVFVMILGPIAALFRWSGHWDVFKRFEVLIAIVVAVPRSIGIMEGAERLAFGRRDREPLSPFLKVAVAVGAVAAVALAIFNAW